jgi:hypothetical protein
VKRSGEDDGAVMVAMVAVHEVEVAIDEVIDVVAVRDGFMTATGSMLMSGFVTAAQVSVGAIGGIVG